MTNLQSLIPPPRKQQWSTCAWVTHKHANSCMQKVYRQTQMQLDSNTNLCCRTSYKSRGEKNNEHEVIDYACMWHSDNNSHVWPLQTVSYCTADEQIKDVTNTPVVKCNMRGLTEWNEMQSMKWNAGERRHCGCAQLCKMTCLVQNKHLCHCRETTHWP